MKITELTAYDKVLIVQADANTTAIITDIDRRYPADVNKPWVIKPYGINQVMLIRNGVNIGVPVDTEVNKWEDETGTNNNSSERQIPG